MFTFGADPEFFISQNSKIISALPLFAEPKDFSPYKLYADNVLLECAIPYSNSKPQVMQILKDMMDLMCIYGIQLKAAHKFEDSLLLHPKAREFGCNPEESAYTMKKIFNEKATREIKFGNWRAAGGHIHLGFNKPEKHPIVYKIILTRILDLLVGSPSVLLDKDPTSIIRKSFYGCAGSHRRTNYGLEYRVLSNFWLKSPIVTELIYDLCEYAMKFDYSSIWEVDYDNAEIKCTKYDEEKFIKLLDSNNPEVYEISKEFLTSELMARIEEVSGREFRSVYEEWATFAASPLKSDAPKYLSFSI